MKIVFIGSGNIAHFFAPLLHKKGHKIVQVYSRTIAHGKELSQLVNAELTDNLNNISREADVYFLAIKDDALQEVAGQLKFKCNMAIHCAGAVSLDVIKDISDNRAVIWALYSVRKNDLPKIDNVPLVVEANNEPSLATALSLAGDISEKVLQIGYRQREWLHLNAVLVNNFTNHLFSVAEQICKENDLPFDFLYPIIFQTVTQIEHSSPQKSQTGPAIRYDEQTIQKHEELLKKHPQWEKLYKVITQSIQMSD